MFSGPVEGILIIITFYIITTFTGPGFWHSSFFALLGLDLKDTELPDIVKGMTLNDAYLVFATVALGFNVYQSSYNVYKTKKASNQSFKEALLGTIPFFTFYGSVFAWAYSFPSIVKYHLLPLCFGIGICFAFTVGRMITAHVSKQSFPVWNPLIFLPLVGILITQLGLHMGLTETLAGFGAVWLMVGISIGVYGSFIAEIIYQITTYLDIGCLYIKRPMKIVEKNK